MKTNPSKSKSMQLNFRVPSYLLKKIDEHIDGIQYLSRGQIIKMALSEWLERNPTVTEERLNKDWGPA